jgi:hypothetical protein
MLGMDLEMENLFISVEALSGEPGKRAQLLGTPKGISNKALEMGVCFYGGPILGNMGDAPS